MNKLWTIITIDVALWAALGWFVGVVELSKLMST